MTEVMKIYITVDENNIIQGWSSTQGMEGEIEVEVGVDHPFLDSIPRHYIYNEGKIVESYSLVLETAKRKKLEELNYECNQRILSGFEYEGYVFQFNEKDQANFLQQLSLLLLDDSVSTVVWKTENEGVQQFTREQFIEACKCGESHKRNNISHYWELKDYVNSLNSVEEIQKVNFNTNVGTNTNVNPEVV
ncbi:hypothetical protein ACNSOF_21290 (plasmid) [Bacillus subtilis]